MTLLDHVRVLRKRAWWVALGVVLGLVAGLLVAFLVPPTYSAQISMYAAAQNGGDSTEANQGAQLSQARVISYVELVTRPRVTKAVISDLGLDTTPDELAKEITASSEQDSVLLDVTVATHDPARSVAIADAIGRVFPGAVDGLEQPLRPGAIPPVAVRVVAPADSAEITSPPWTVPVAFGLLAGLVLGVSLALLRNATDTSVSSAATLREVTGLPLLATTYTQRGAAAREAFVPARDAPGSPTAEAVRRLRTNLQYLDVDDPPRDHVADRGAADLPVAHRRAVGVDVPVQQPGGLEPGQHAVQGLDAEVGRVVAVAEAGGRRVREQHVDRAAEAGRPDQLPGPAGVLPLGVLVRSGPVAHAAAEAGDPQACDLDGAPVGVDRAAGAGRLRLPAQPHVAAWGAGFRVVVAGHEDDRRRGRVPDPLDVFPREVAGGQHQVRGQVAQRRCREVGCHLVGDHQRVDHSSTLAPTGSCLTRVGT